MNTAKMRVKARFYESMLDWEKAAMCWNAAIDLYPKPYPKFGELELRDIAKMQSNANACRYMAEQESVCAK